MNQDIRARLLQLNPWLRNPARFVEGITHRVPAGFIPRRLDLSRGDPRRARLLVGPRQVGKSTFIWSMLRDRPPETVLVLNAEESLVRAWLASAGGVIADLESDLPGVRTLFLEEAQQLEEPGLLVKGLVDAARGLDILVTGSSAYDLMARTRESLAGRATRRRLLPLSLREILEHEPSPTPAVQHQRAHEIVRRQLVWGGYPGVWLHPEPSDELAELVEAFIVRDASDRFHVQRPDAFRRLLQLCATQVGQMVNLSEWASLLGIAATTVREYLSILEDSWIVHLLPAFAGGRRLELTSAARVHLYDMGLRNALLGGFSTDLPRRPDLGALVEGWVFGELVKGQARGWVLHYWRAKGGAEVDFVLTSGERRIGVEVKAGRQGKLTRSARSFIEAYSPELFVVASLGGEPGSERIGSTEVRWVGLEGVAAVVERQVAGSPFELG